MTTSYDDRLIISSVGDVVIGTTTNTLYKLNSVGGTLHVTRLLVGGVVVTGSKWTNNTVTDTKIYYNSGNVGIGTTDSTN